MYNEPKRKVRRPEAVKEMAHRRGNVRRKRSLMVRMFLLVCVTILGPSLLMLLVFYRTIPARMESQAKGNVNFYISQVTASVANTMELAQDIAYNAMIDDSLCASMQDLDMYLALQGRDDLLRVVGGVAAYQSTWKRGAVNSVYLFRRDGAFTFYSPRGSYEQEQRRMQSIYEAANEQSSAETLFSIENTPENTAYFLLDYKNIDTLEPLGKLIMEIDVDTLLNAGDLTELYPNTCLALSDGEGKLLYGEGEDLQELLEQTEDNSSYLQGTAPGWQGRFYHVSQRVDDEELRVDIFIPLPSMYDLVWEGSWIFSALCIAIVLLTVLAAAVAYHRVLGDPLQKMEGMLHRMAESDYAARMPDSGYRELADLETTFNQMADNLEASWKDAYQKGIRLQESESRLLAAQINPHFIFNVLETINMRCVDAGLKNISRMVTDLACLLRGNIGVGSSQKITFEQELGYVHYYLDLQRERFGEKLSYSVEYEDEDLLRYLVPRLTIQPLVENAIAHGLEPRRGLGSVAVRLWEETQNICVRIEDDGVGFDPENLDLAREVESAGQHNHIALTNVLRRLHLLYGDRADLQIRSKPGQGTTVLLTLPLDQTKG